MKEACKNIKNNTFTVIDVYNKFIYERINFSILIPYKIHDGVVTEGKTGDSLLGKFKFDDSILGPKK